MRLKLNKAFSLLEVLITVAVLATAIVFVLRSFTAALASARFSQNMSLACFLAENKLWELEQRYNDGLELPPGGSEIIQNRKFDWRYETNDTDTPELKKINFIISWLEKSREKEYTIEFMTYFHKS